MTMPRILLFLALMLTRTAAQTDSVQAKLPDLKTTEALGAGLFADTASTGMVLVVVRGNEVYFHGYGETAPGSHTAPTAQSMVRLCSLTKIFTTDLLSRLAAEKTLALDDPLAKYAPPRAVVPQREKPITLVDLATHTAGLARELGTPPRGTPHFTYPDAKTRWRWLASQQLKSVPGTEALYSNVGYDLLGDALARAARKPLPDLLLERTLNPLKMWQTTYYPTPEQCARLMTSAHDDGACTPAYQTAGSGGLYSTAADMTTWLKYLLGTGAPQLPAQDAAAQAVVLDPARLKKEFGLDHAGAPTGIGLGWMHLGQPGDAAHIIEKTGGGAGFSTYIALLPARHAGLFVAVTDGPIGWQKNLFKEANNALLALNSLPPLPEEPSHPVHRAAHKARQKPGAKAARKATPKTRQKAAPRRRK
ncbi:MAG: D-alanyl-D-alanine-carboxypeptidase/endopeptidase AmpH [Terracidiphilus sp.]